MKGYWKMPSSLYAQRIALFGDLTPKAKLVWDILDEAVDDGVLEYRDGGHDHNSAGYYAPRDL
jgi:hypothetical protein